MLVDYFYSLTPRQFYNILTGFRRKEEIQERSEWERSRMLMYAVMLPHAGKKTFTQQDIMKFPWEEVSENKKKVKPLSSSEIEKLFEGID